MIATEITPVQFSIVGNFLPAIAASLATTATGVKIASRGMPTSDGGTTTRDVVIFEPQIIVRPAHGFPIGAKLYLSDSVLGGIVALPPIIDTSYIQQIGSVIDQNKILINIQNPVKVPQLSVGNPNLGSVRANYATASITIPNQGIYHTFDLKSVPSGQTMAPSQYPQGASPNYSAMFDASRSGTLGWVGAVFGALPPTGRLYENPVLLQQHIWRIQATVSRPSGPVGSGRTVILSLINPNTGIIFGNVTPLDEANLVTAGSSYQITSIIHTLSDPQSNSGQGGYVISARTTANNNSINVRIDQVLRSSLSTQS